VGLANPRLQALNQSGKSTKKRCNMSKTFNPVSTSGIGFKLEHYVQASYMASLLLETPVPFGSNAKVVELEFQAKLHANTDDLIVHFSNGSKFFLQSKKGFEINANETFYEVIDAAWKDFNSTGFDKKHHRFIVSTDILSKADAENGLLLLEWARFSKDAAEFGMKLKANAQKKAKYKFFADALTKANGTLPTNDVILDFLQTFYIQTFDYLQVASKDNEVLKWYIHPFLGEGKTSDDVLLSLLRYVQTCNQHGATVTRPSADESVKDLFNLSKSPAISNELTELIKKSNGQLQYTIHNQIGGYHIERGEHIAAIQEQLNEKKYVVITGEGGVGKSGLAKDFLNAFQIKGGNFIVFKADLFDRPSLAHSLTDIGIHSDLETLLAQWRLLPKLLVYIDSFEKLYESENKEAFVEFLGKLNNTPNVKILATCRSYAVETLRGKYRIPKNELNTFNLPTLTEQQLQDIASVKPNLKPLIGNQKLKKLITLPFYLDIALQNADSLEDGQNLSEREFKRFLWEHRIQKKGAGKFGTAIKRAITFSDLVLKRAIEKLPYTKPDSQADHDVIAELEKDELIIKHPSLEAYSPAHDIFEDMVVINHLNELFQNKENSFTFIQSVDPNPIFRRAIRLWIQSLITEQPTEAKLFLSEVFPLHRNLPLIDELLIGILGSEESYALITQNVELFLKDNLALFFKTFHLLKTAYTQPYEGSHPERKVKCVGHGWTALLKVMENHYSAYPKYFDVISLDLLNHWTYQFGDDDPLPNEGNIVAKHAYRLFKEDKETFRFASKREKLEVLFFVAPYAKTEIQNLLQNSIEARKTNSTTTEYKISFYREFFEMLLKETFRCVKVYNLYPEQIINLAELEWYKGSESDGEYLDYSHDYRERSYGLRSYPYDYFSPSAYQTPFRYLFRYHPEIALVFLISLCNRCASFYKKSGYAKQDSVKNISLVLGDGTRLTLIGSATLWDTYRGLSNAPYLLQSALMAFEVYLLELAEGDGISDHLFDKVMRESNSVLTVGVLASIATAYPLAFKENVLVLLQRREFFGWDLSRYTAEMAHGLSTTIGNDPYYTKERRASNALKHRQQNLENLVSILQFYYTKEINELIDSFKASIEPDDYLWQLALTRMDLRNTKLEIKEEENIAVFNPNPLPEQLQDFIDEGKEEREQDSSAISIFLWADKAFSEKEQVQLTYEIWRNYLEKLRELQPSAYKMFDSRKKLAAIGIRNFADGLTDEEKEFCVSTTLEDVHKVMAALKLGHSNSTIDVFNDTTYSVLPLLLKPVFNRIVDEASFKELLTELILLLPYEIKQHLISGVHKYLWEVSEETGKRVFQTLLKHSQVDDLGYVLQYHRSDTEEMISGTINAYIATINEAVDVPPENIDITGHNARKIIQALQSVPYVQLNGAFKPYIDQILEQIGNSQDKEELEEFEFVLPLQILFGHYLIHNSDNNSIDTVVKLLQLESSKTHFGFLVDTLKHFVWIGHDAKYPEQFWFHINFIWTYVQKVSPKVYLVETILLKPLKNIQWCYKLPEKGLGRNIHEMIISEYAADTNLVEAVFKLLAGAGTSYQPQCLTWLLQSLPDRKSYDSNFGLLTSTEYLNLFVQQIYDNHLGHIQKNKAQFDYYIMLLNILIDRGSSQAFRIRDELL
jgi:hypothetical protein